MPQLEHGCPDLQCSNMSFALNSCQWPCGGWQQARVARRRIWFKVKSHNKGASRADVQESHFSLSFCFPLYIYIYVYKRALIQFVCVCVCVCVCFLIWLANQIWKSTPGNSEITFLLWQSYFLCCCCLVTKLCPNLLQPHR